MGPHRWLARHTDPQLKQRIIPGIAIRPVIPLRPDLDVKRQIEPSRRGRMHARGRVLHTIDVDAPPRAWDLEIPLVPAIDTILELEIPVRERKLVVIPIDRIRVLLLEDPVPELLVLIIAVVRLEHTP